MLRLKRDVGKENTLGMVATSYNFIDKHNQVLGIDGRFRLDKQTTVSFQTLGTTSRNFFFDPNDGETRYRTGNGFGYSADYNVSGRNWGWEVYGEGFTKDYRADVGFFQRTNSNFNYGFLRYNSDPNSKKKIISYHVHNLTHVDYDWQGRIMTARGTYQFTKATFARLILDYNTLNSRLRSQALFGWTPSPGTAFYAGYNDDLNYASPHPFTTQLVPGFRRNARTFFIKASYLIRRGF